MPKRRVKKHTNLGARPAQGQTPAKTGGLRTPKSMVIRMGAKEVGPSVSQLAQDVRMVMEPNTASKLKERRTNRLKDYTVMAGPLGVSHLLLFSRSARGNVHLRLALAPRGPTLHFRVERYALCRDVRRAQRHPRGGGKEYAHAPLLVMNNFTTPETPNAQQPPPATGANGKSAEAPQAPPAPAVPRHLEALTTNVFQSLFPAIAPQKTPLRAIQRVLLLDRELPRPKPPPSGQQPPPVGAADAPAYALDFRHYAITTRATGLSRGVRRINAAERRLREGSRARSAAGTPARGGGSTTGAMPDLGRLDDVADYLLDPGAAGAAGFTSGSESEVETDAEVEVLEAPARKVLSAKKFAARQQQQARAPEDDDTNAGAEGAGSTSSRRRAEPRPRVEKRAVRLVELGPRMRLRLIKVEEGVCEGKVMWHEFVTKSRAEVKALDRVWEERRRAKEERKRVQRENVERKRRERQAAAGQGGQGEDGEEGEAMEVDGEEEWDTDDYEMEDYVQGNGAGGGGGQEGALEVSAG